MLSCVELLTEPRLQQRLTLTTMANNNTEFQGLTFSQTTNVIVEDTPTYYAVQKSEWDYLKKLISKCDASHSWIEILTSTFLSIGISFIIAFYTTNNPPNCFGFIGYSGCGVGLLGIAVCLFIRNTNKSQTIQIQEYFQHIEDHRPTSSK